MLPHERARVEREAVMRFRIWAVIGPTLPVALFVVPVALSLGMIFGFRGLTAAIVIPAAPAIIAVMFWGCWRREQQLSRRYTELLRARYEPDLTANEVEEWRVRILDAIKIEDLIPEQEGPRFLLELEDGRVLFLSGLYLTQPEREQRFPNTELLLTRLPHAGDTLALECLGEYLAPSFQLPPFLPEDWTADVMPRDGQIVPGPFADYKVELDEDQAITSHTPMAKSLPSVR
jgi:hypothetical protein